MSNNIISPRNGHILFDEMVVGCLDDIDVTVYGLQSGNTVNQAILANIGFTPEVVLNLARYNKLDEDIKQSLKTTIHTADDMVDFIKTDTCIDERYKKGFCQTIKSQMITQSGAIILSSAYVNMYKKCEQLTKERDNLKEQVEILQRKLAEDMKPTNIQ